MTRETREHLIGHALLILIWLFWFGSAALDELLLVVG